MNIDDLIKQFNLEEEAKNIRRHIHSNPDLSEHEEGTMNYICELLSEWKIEHKKGVAQTGVVAIVRGKMPGKTVALRGDMDALPIKEKTGLDFASKIDGVMHACGHDAHITILLVTAFALKQMEDELKGNVKFFFQPAEETTGGAERMIKEGCLHEPEVDYILALHVEPAYETGYVGLRYGKMYAASDMINITVSGKSAHGAHPDEGVDSIVVATNIINTIQTVISRNVSPLNSAVCTIGKIDGGTVRNQIADRVRMEGIIRTLDPKTRIEVRERIGKICIETGKVMGATVEYHVMESYGPLINNDDVTKIVERNAVDFLGKNHVIIESAPDLSCEDFSYFALEKPSCYFHLGCYNQSNGPRVDLHHPQFTIDERCLAIGIKLQLKNIITLLNEGV